MDIEKLYKDVNETFENIKSYFDLKIELFTIILYEKILKVFSSILAVIIIAIFLLFFIFFMSLAFVAWYGQETGSFAQGYLIAGLFYLILGIIIYLARNKIFLNPIIKKISKTIFNTENEFSHKKDNTTKQ